MNEYRSPHNVGFGYALNGTAELSIHIKRFFAMKYESKEAFEKANIFGTGTANTAYAQYFIGNSFLNPLTDPKSGLEENNAV